MNNYIKIEIKTSSKEQSEILIAELSGINFDAFEEADDSLSAFIKEENFNDDELNEIFSSKNIYYSKTTIADTNWNAKWESEFEPVIVNDFVAVRANFHQPIKNVKHEIIITPKMSFGTGHHATTYLMLQQMEGIDFTNNTVLDFGTGTGVLAIMAKKSGAQKVVAIDNDEWSINNAKENFAANNCNGIILRQRDNLHDIGKFDIVLANINLNIITNSIDQLNLITHPTSQLLLSGFLFTDEHILIKKFTTAGFAHVATYKRNEWIAMLLTKS
jgi:Ribosomal protein L11 methylase